MTGSGVLIYEFKFPARGADESAIADASRGPLVLDTTVFRYDLEERNARPALVVDEPPTRS
jgi:hypothetical protein